MPYKFSPSSLSILKDCPRCFWLRFKTKIRRPEGIFPSLPRGMDRILKEHFDKFMDKGKLPPELKELKDVELFDDKEQLDIWRNNFKGVQWTDKKGNILRGAVDNILKKGKKLVVLDYKTRGYPLKEDTAGHYQDQMDIYNFLLRKNKFDTEDYAYLLFYHPDKVNDKGDVVFHNDLVKMEVNVNNAEKILKKALDILNNDIPKAHKECEFCNWIDVNNDFKAQKKLEF